MTLEKIFFESCNIALYACCLFILSGSIFISIKTRFIQIRLLPQLFRMAGQAFSKNKQQEQAHTILPYKALFTAMSTTLGIGTIVAPVIAINLGGPGALLGFLLTSFFGSAATYTEVNLAIRYREKLPSGQIMGGPMQYLKRLASPKIAKWYALCCLFLMPAWSGAQANQLAAMLNSPLLGDYKIPLFVSGLAIVAIVMVCLIGGIKRVGAVEAKLIPIKFALYVGACLFIIGMNISKMPEILSLIFKSALSPYSMASGAAVGGLMQSMRWGIFKGSQCCEAGLGTQTIAHSMAETQDPVAQGALAMCSTYASGIIAFMSGCVALITGTWENPNLPIGMSMVAASFNIYFTSFGVIMMASCAVFFAFGTILGNGYNGGQTFAYLSGNKRLPLYYAVTALMIFLGSILDVKLVWAFTDILLAGIALPHMTFLMLHTLRKPQESLANS